MACDRSSQTSEQTDTLLLGTYNAVFITVDRAIFTIKIFRQLLRRRKLNVQKFLTRVFNFRHMATWQKLNVQIFFTHKKSYTKISQSTVGTCFILGRWYKAYVH